MNLLWIELGYVRVLRCCIERLQVLLLVSSMAQEIEIFTFVGLLFYRSPPVLGSPDVTVLPIADTTNTYSAHTQSMHT